MLPDRVSNPGPLTYESGALPIALRSPAIFIGTLQKVYSNLPLLHSERPKLYGVLAVLSAMGLTEATYHCSLYTKVSILLIPHHEMGAC